MCTITIKHYNYSRSIISSKHHHFIFFYTDCPEVHDLIHKGESQLPSLLCIYSSSSSCVSVCRNPDNQATVELSLPGVYAVTGFIIHSLNDTVQTAVNLTENRILYNTLTSTDYTLEEPVQVYGPVLYF